MEMTVYTFEINSDNKKNAVLFNNFIKKKKYKKICVKKSENIINEINIYLHQNPYIFLREYRTEDYIIYYHCDKYDKKIKNYILYDLNIGRNSHQYYVGISNKKQSKDDIYDFLSYVTNDIKFNGLLDFQYPKYCNINILINQMENKAYVAKLKVHNGLFNEMFNSTINMLVDCLNFQLISIDRVYPNNKKMNKNIFHI